MHIIWFESIRLAENNVMFYIFAKGTKSFGLILSSILVLIFCIGFGLLYVGKIASAKIQKMRTAKITGMSEEELNYDDGHWFASAVLSNHDFHEGVFDRNYPAVITYHYDPEDEIPSKFSGDDEYRVVKSFLKVTWHEKGTGKICQKTYRYDLPILTQLNDLLSAMLAFFEEWDIPYQFEELPPEAAGLVPGNEKHEKEAEETDIDPFLLKDQAESQQAQKQA